MKTATLRLDTHFAIAPVDRRLFSGFLEHLGRAVYEGVYDPGNPRSNSQGFRTDVLALLKQWQMPTVRYPGGNYVSAWDWKDSIGPQNQRPRRPDYAWQSIETNQFGIHEFMDWCRVLGTDPMMAVNLGTGSVADAAQLLEYCNMPAGTYWADRRKQNGHAEPFNVKLWCLGNEMDGPWQAGHVPAAVYAQRANQAAMLMKGLDASIETIVCGSSHNGMSTYLEWDRTCLEYCWNHIDFISAHRYSANRDNNSAHFLSDGVEIDRILDDYAGLLAYVRGVKKSSKHVHVSFDEWNVWYKATPGNGHWTTAGHLLEEVYNLEDALVCAQYLASFVRHADTVKIACIAQIVNVIGPILTRPEGCLVQSNFYPLEMFSRLARGDSLRCRLDSPLYHAGPRGEVPLIDAAATFDPATGNLAIFLINRGQADAINLSVAVDDRILAHINTAELLTGPDVKAANTWENQTLVAPTKAAAIIEKGTLLVTVPKTSMVALQVSTAVR